jgi:itaconyl-CoA hydratase
LTLHYVPLYLNAAWAEAHGRPGNLINPYLVFLLVLGMSVEDTSEGVDGAEGAFLGVKRVEHLADVVDGDTITARTTVVAKRSSGSRPHAGIVTWRTTGRNQRGIDVLRFERTNLISRRPEREPFQRFTLSRKATA